MMTFGAEAVIVVWSVRASVDNGSSHAPPAPARRFGRCRRPSLQRRAHSKPSGAATSAATTTTTATTAAATAEHSRHLTGARYGQSRGDGDVHGSHKASTQGRITVVVERLQR